jgi:Tol biopolymer transport system component
MNTGQSGLMRFATATSLALAILVSNSTDSGARDTAVARTETVSPSLVHSRPMTNGVIAFTRGYAPGGLEVMDPTGGHRRGLAGCRVPGCRIVLPVWSSNGKRIAFLRGRPLRSEVQHESALSLFVKNADGSGEKWLAGCGRPVWCDYSRLAWSPDGWMIAFTRQRSLYTVNVETHALRRITNCSPWFFSRDRKKSCVDRGPAWSPDGRRITFFRAWACGLGCPSTPFIVNADGSGLRRLTLLQGDGSGPLWSPNGRTIVFNTYRGIYAVDPDGTHLRLLAAPPESANQIQFVSSWSLDGRRILYFRVQFSYPTPSANGEVWVMNANGSGRRRLFVRCCGASLANPIWSPDGKYIAFSAVLPPQRGSGIYLMDANGNHVHRVLAGNWADLTWQPIP